ncbi:hypothetical protein ACB094_07G023200 [Castanea mollissima]
MLTRLVVWMGFCTSFCCCCGLCYFNHHWQGHGPMCTKVVSEHEDGQECSLTKCQFSHDQVSNKYLRESQRFKPRLRHSLPHERMEKHTLPLLGSTQREVDSKREITVIVACTVEEDGEVIMDLEQMDEQQTLDILLHAISADQCTQDEEVVPSGKPSETGFIMGSEFENQDSDIISIFLELLGFDDLIGFKSSMEEDCHYIVEGSLWYGRRIGSKMMGFKEKIALMTATMFGCKGELNFILETSCVDVNQACGLDGLLHFLLLLLWTLLFQPPFARTWSYVYQSGIRA